MGKGFGRVGVMKRSVDKFDEMTAGEREALLVRWFREAGEESVGDLVAGRRMVRVPTLVMKWSGGREVHMGLAVFVREPGK
jgi:hypothetical protein